MIKRTKKQRLEQQQADAKLATVYASVKASDGALKIFNNRLDAMPERRLTFISRNVILKHKRFNTFAKA